MYSGKAQTSDSSFLFNIISLGWSIEYIEGSQAMISKPLKIAFVLANRRVWMGGGGGGLVFTIH